MLAAGVPLFDMGPLGVAVPDTGAGVAGAGGAGM